MSQEDLSRNLQIALDYKKYKAKQMTMLEMILKWKRSASRLHAIGQYYADRV